MMTPAVRQILSESWRKGAGLWLDFANDRYFQQGVGSGIDLISVSRASIGTDLLPSSPSGASYLTFAANTPRRSALAGGLLVEEARTQLSAFPAAPQNETITIGATGTYTLWVNGSGSAAVAAGTAVGSGFGTATNGTPVVFAISSTGTVGITVTGSLQALQVELGTWGSSFIPQAATVRAADVVTPRVPPVSTGGAITLFVDFVQPAVLIASRNHYVAQLDDGTSGNRHTMFLGSAIGKSTSANSFAAAASAGRIDTSAAFVGGVSVRVAYATAPSDRAIISGGVVGAASATCTPIIIAAVRIGGDEAGASQLNSVIRSVAIFLSRPSNSDLQRLTAP